MSAGDRVVLKVPSSSEYARTVRLVAAELATRAGMDIDGIDDVRMAVEEAFVYAVEHLAGPELEFAFTVHEGSIELDVSPLSSDCAGEEAPDSSERFARFILETMCDSCEIGEIDGVYRLRVVKSAG